MKIRWFYLLVNFFLVDLSIAQDIISTVVGTGSSGYSGDNGLATSAMLNFPYTVVLDANDNVYIGDSENHVIRKMTVSTGIISTIAGTGTSGFSGDNGLATSATLYHPEGLSIDSSGNVYIADTTNNYIRIITVSSGIIKSIAGSSTSGDYGGDGGAATSAKLKTPVGVAVDSTGNTYIGDTYNYRIRKVTDGIISTIAGTGTDTFSGDGGSATSAALNAPRGIYVDSSGNVYIADVVNNRIRLITASTGIITTIVGSGTSGSSGSYSGDGFSATSATLNHPRGVVIDSSGNLFISDTENNVIREVVATTGIINTIAGTGTGTYSGDGGLATVADLFNPMGVSIDSSGNIYIADAYNYRIRMVTNPTPPTLMPTNIPSHEPTLIPTFIPTFVPSLVPTILPTEAPTILPTEAPTILPTVVPSLEPTTTPTSVLGVSIFDKAMSPKVAEEKTRYYIVSFVAFFTSIVVILYFIKWSKCGRSTVERLHKSAYKSKFYRIKLYSASRSRLYEHDSSILGIAMSKNRELLRISNRGDKHHCDDDKDPNIHSYEDQHRITTADSIRACIDEELFKEPHLITTTTGSIRTCINRIKESSYKECNQYLNYVVDHRHLLGCGPVLFCEGVTLSSCFFTIRLPPGYIEDVILFLCNNNEFFKMLYCIESQDSIKDFGIIVYVVRSCVVLVLSQFILALVQFFSVDAFVYASPFVNILFITPMSIAFQSALVTLYTAPYAEAVGNKHIKAIIRFLSKLTIIPMLLVLSIALISVCILTTSRKVPLILSEFFVTVMLWSIVVEVLLTMIGRCDNYYCRLVVCGFEIISYGDYYVERIISEELVSGIDFFVDQRTYLAGTVNISTILCRSDVSGIELVTSGTVTIPVASPLFNTNSEFSTKPTSVLNSDALSISNTIKSNTQYVTKTKVGASNIDPSMLYTDINL